MKFALSFLVFAAALSAQAGNQCTNFYKSMGHCRVGQFKTNLGCDSYEEVRCANVITEKDLSENVIGRVQDTLVGELDPEVLGDGGLMLIKGSSRNYVILEPIEQPGLIPLLEDMSKKGVIVAIPNSALGRVRPDEKSMMKSLAERYLGLKGTATYLEILD